MRAHAVADGALACQQHPDPGAPPPREVMGRRDPPRKACWSRVVLSLCPVWDLLAGWMGVMPMPWGLLSSSCLEKRWILVGRNSPTPPSHHPTIPPQGPPPWPPIPVSPDFSSKLGHPSLVLSHQFTSSPGPPVAAPGCRARAALALGKIRSARETSGSGFGGLSPVPALALTASSFVLLTA